MGVVWWYIAKILEATGLYQSERRSSDCRDYLQFVELYSRTYGPRHSRVWNAFRFLWYVSEINIIGSDARFSCVSSTFYCFFTDHICSKAYLYSCRLSSAEQIPAVSCSERYEEVPDVFLITEHLRQFFYSSFLMPARPVCAAILEENLNKLRTNLVEIKKDKYACIRNP